MKSSMILSLMLCGLLLRMHGWQFVVQKQKGLGFFLVIGGTLVTLSLVVLLAASATP